MDDQEHDAEKLAKSQDPSFLRRLAGPSAHKVGYGIDQAEINRRIAEASKGSKFYENEKRRDADWTERIDRILERRDELLKSSDIQRVEAKVDRIFAEKESKRDLSQTIVHVDMDAFFANVELQHNPDLKDKPFAVVGLGVVTTGSYEARKFGVRAGQPEYIAKRLCPGIILVPVDYKRVAAMSARVMDVCRRYDPRLYIAGCDEAYLNITKYLQEHNLVAEDCVRELRTKIFEETNLTASAGIAPNMMLAKICSDKNKPNGQYQMPSTREAVIEFMRDLPVRKVPGIGRVGERVLEAIGVKTCGDINSARAIIWLMPRKFAVDFLFDTHLGLSTTIIKPYQREERKSVGVSRTFRAVDTKEAIFQKLEYIASLLERDLETEGWAGKIVILTYKLANFRVHTRRATFERWISKKEDLLNIGKELIKPCLPLRVRLLGLRVTDLIDLRAPLDQGIKRFFAPDSSDRDGSPKKKRRSIPEPSPSSEPFSPSKRNSIHQAESFIKPTLVDEEEAEEEELVGGVGEDEDELYDDEHDPMEQAYSGDKHMAEPDRDVPTLQYRYAVNCTVKIGNDKFKTKSKKPSSAIARIRPFTATTLPERSKSEQPSTRADLIAPRSESGPRCECSIQPTSPSKTALPSKIGGERESTISICPVCSRRLETDNTGLNAHIDFCLSRSAIMEASSVAVSSIPVLQPKKSKK